LVILRLDRRIQKRIYLITGMRNKFLDSAVDTVIKKQGQNDFIIITPKLNSSAYLRVILWLNQAFVLALQNRLNNSIKHYPLK